MITVIDSICGKGKTTAMINKMKDDKLNRYLYITPFLDEVDRVVRETGCKKPNNYGLGKGDSLIKLLESHQNIAASHELFRRVDEKIIDYIETGRYTLIMDEVMDVIQHIKLSSSDIELLQKFIDVAEDGKVTWLDDSYSGKFSDVKEIANREQLYFCNNQFFMWMFPVNVFKSFKDIYICTYLFDYQVQKYYYDLHDLKYEKVSVESGNIIPYIFQTDGLDKIHIYDGKLNYIGDSRYSLSMNWYKKKKEIGSLKLLKNNMENYRRHIVSCKSKDVLWTTFSEYQDSLSGSGYKSSFLSHNARAINRFMDRHYVMYCVNKFISPVIDKFFEVRGIKVDEDMFALSEMLQFLYRSAIRKGEDVYCYIPSERMRNLLLNFQKEKGIERTINK